MELSSTAFENNGQMPDRFGYTNENVNPPLSFENVPEAAEELVLIMDDPDAREPAGKVWDHWVLYNISPATDTIAEGETPRNAVTGQNDYGELGYGGPNPPDGEHTYVFTLYALDTALNLSEGASKADVESAIQGHILAEARLNGTFAPSQSN